MRITELFDNGEFVVTAEVGPPKGIHIAPLVEEAKEHLSGITAVNVTDNQSSVMRMGSLPACVALKNGGLTPILQLTCRDRNRVALQSELLGAAALGIENILCLTGDHTRMGDHPGAKPVFDLDSVSLLHTVCQLEKGVDLGGNPLLGEAPRFAKGAVVSPCSDSVDAQLVKMERKVMAGAEFFQTQADLGHISATGFIQNTVGQRFNLWKIFFQIVLCTIDIRQILHLFLQAFYDRILYLKFDFLIPVCVCCPDHMKPDQLPVQRLPVPNQPPGPDKYRRNCTNSNPSDLFSHKNTVHTEITSSMDGKRSS